MWTIYEHISPTSDGKFIRTFDSINDAVRATGISKESISRCCRNIQSTAGKFKWEFNHDSRGVF